MRKLKRVVAITLAATMVAGGSLMSFAAGEPAVRHRVQVVQKDMLIRK